MLFSVGGFTNDFNVDADIRNYTVRGGLVLPTGTLAPLGGVGGSPILGDAYHVVGYGVAQDEWTLARDWTFTGGVRMDHYSDFGAQWTPRAALVFSPTPQATFKALYGEAFRPPAAVELQSNGTADALGNPDLKPMQIHMGELDAGYRLERLEATLAVFAYRVIDLIGTQPDPTVPTGLQYVNAGPDSGHGIEAGLQWQASRRLQASVQYSYQRHANVSTDVSDTQRAPRQLLNATLNWEPASTWSAYFNSLAVADRGRPPGDERPDPPNYLLLNFALRKRWGDRFSARFRVSNLLNHLVSDPSNSTTALPDDVSEPGRMWRVEIMADF